MTLVYSCTPSNKVAVNWQGARDIGALQTFKAIGHSIYENRPRLAMINTDLREESSGTARFSPDRVNSTISVPPAYEELNHGDRSLPIFISRSNSTATTSPPPSYKQAEESKAQEKQEKNGVRVLVSEVNDFDSDSINNFSSNEQSVLQNIVAVAYGALGQLTRMMPDLRAQSFSNVLSTIQNTVTSLFSSVFTSQELKSPMTLEPDSEQLTHTPNASTDSLIHPDSKKTSEHAEHIGYKQLSDEDYKEMLAKNSDQILERPEMMASDNAEISKAANSFILQKLQAANKEGQDNKHYACRSFVDSNIIKHPEYFTHGSPDVRDAAVQRMKAILNSRTVVTQKLTTRNLPAAALLRPHMIDHPNMDVRKAVYKRLELMLSDFNDRNLLRQVINEGRLTRSENPKTREFARMAMNS